MRGTLTKEPEVIDRRNDATSHQMVPDSVDDDAGCQRVRWVVDLFSQLQSATSRLNRHWGVTRHCGQEMAMLAVSWFRRVAANQHVIVFARAGEHSEGDPRLFEEFVFRRAEVDQV